MSVANGQGIEEIRSRINLAQSAFSRLQSCLWSRREILLRTKERVYQAVVRSILLNGCETWPARVADERMLEVLQNDSIRCILHVKRRDCVPSVNVRRRLCLPSIPAQLVQGRLTWSRCKKSRWRIDQGPTSADTASHFGQANWRLAEDVGNHDQGRPGATLRSLRLGTIEKGFD